MISGFVISYNRERILRTTLRSIRFVDELIVVDKSSSDASVSVARDIADRVISVPWSPTVEETRAFAASQCTGDFIVFLDDDECLDADAIEFLKKEGREPRYDIYELLCRHYVLSRHDEDCYYWPERHTRAFRRNAVNFNSRVHAGAEQTGTRIWQAPLDSNICFHNLSHADAFAWIEKTNRYTSAKERAGTATFVPSVSLMQQAEAAMRVWQAKIPAGANQYVEAVTLLRAVYDLVDLVKRWEQDDASVRSADFEDICRKLEDTYTERKLP